MEPNSGGDSPSPTGGTALTGQKEEDRGDPFFLDSLGFFGCSETTALSDMTGFNDLSIGSQLDDDAGVAAESDAINGLLLDDISSDTLFASIGSTISDPKVEIAFGTCSVADNGVAADLGAMTNFLGLDGLSISIDASGCSVASFSDVEEGSDDLAFGTSFDNGNDELTADHGALYEHQTKILLGSNSNEIQFQPASGPQVQWLVAQIRAQGCGPHAAAISDDDLVYYVQNTLVPQLRILQYPGETAEDVVGAFNMSIASLNMLRNPFYFTSGSQQPSPATEAKRGQKVKKNTKGVKKPVSRRQGCNKKTTKSHDHGDDNSSRGVCGYVAGT